jgi:hypothetical protein
MVAGFWIGSRWLRVTQLSDSLDIPIERPVVSLNPHIWQFWSDGVALLLKIDPHAHPISDWKLPPQHDYIYELDGYGSAYQLQPGDTDPILTQYGFTLENVVVEVVYRQGGRRGIFDHYPEEFRLAKYLVLPYWFLFPLCVGGTLFIHWRRLEQQVSGFKQRRRVAAGKCAFCGYDVRATPARCPECGLVPTPSTTSAHAKNLC